MENFPDFGRIPQIPKSMGKETPYNSSVAPIGGLNVVLTPQESEGEILSVFRSPGSWPSGLHCY